MPDPDARALAIGWPFLAAKLLLVNGCIALMWRVGLLFTTRREQLLFNAVLGALMFTYALVVGYELGAGF